MSRTTAVFTTGFSSSTQSSATICHGQQLFPLPVLEELLRAAQPRVTDKSCFTTGFSSSTESSAAISHGQQLFSLADLEELLRAALLFVTDNSCFHWRF